MVSRVLGLSLQHRWLVVVCAFMLLLGGLFRSSDMAVDVFPDLTAPRVTIVTESTGAAAEEIEQLITFPIETAVNGAAGLRQVRSASAPGISVVWAEFDWQTDGTVARQRITERLQSVVGSLPADAGVPLLAPASSVMGEIAFVALRSEKLSSMELRHQAEVLVRRRLLGIAGVSQVVVIGGERKQYQVLLEPHRLDAYKLTMDDVLIAISQGSQNASGGYIVDGGQESVVRVLGQAHGVSDLQRLVVATRDDVAVRLRDIAVVQEGAAVARGSASFNAQPAVLLSVVKQPEADTLSTTKHLEKVLDDLERTLQERHIILHRDVFRQQEFIDTAIANVLHVLRDGALLVVIVLFLFLWSLRPTLISLLAIPLSLVTATWVLSLFGYTLDTMTLGGLAIAMGELVDDAIVDVENVGRRLRERSKKPVEGRESVLETVYQASMEIRPAIVSTTIVLLLVFVPLLFLDGLEGRLLQPLAIAYITAIFASFIVAITITPVLCSWWLVREHTTQQEPPLIVRLQQAYLPVLHKAMSKPRHVIAGAALLVVIGSLAFAGLGRSFLPQFNERSMTINMVLAPGTALSESNALGVMAEQVLLADPGVISVARRTGRAERDEHVLGVESTEMEVRVDPTDTRTRQQLFADIRERLAVVPAQFSLGQPISHRIEHMISGQRSALSIKIFAEDLRELRRVAERVKTVMEGVPGVVDLGSEQIVDIPQYVVQVDADAAAVYGFSTGTAAAAIGTALWGKTAGYIPEKGTTTQVVVRYPNRYQRDDIALQNVPIPTPLGALVPVSALAQVRRDSGPNYILRENVARRLVVTANVASGDVRGVYENVRSRIESQITLPEDVYIVYAGQFTREDTTNRRLFVLGFLVVLGIGSVVTTTLGSVRRSMIVLVNLPLSLAGGVIGVYLAGGVLSVATTIGFITLFGIAVRNGILLASRCRDLEEQGIPRQEAVILSAQERLAPIVMTATTAALALLPLALALGQPGTEIQAPMALVILTGLVTSTLLNMLVVPVLIAQWGGGVEVVQLTVDKTRIR